MPKDGHIIPGTPKTTVIAAEPNTAGAEVIWAILKKADRRTLDTNSYTIRFEEVHETDGHVVANATLTLSPQLGGGERSLAFVIGGAAQLNGEALHLHDDRHVKGLYTPVNGNLVKINPNKLARSLPQRREDVARQIIAAVAIHGHDWHNRPGDRIRNGFGPEPGQMRKKRLVEDWMAVATQHGQTIADHLSNDHLQHPNRPMRSYLAEVIAAGLRGERVTIFGAFCPDYAYERTGNPHVPYRYTFRGLGNGVGLVARNMIRMTKQVHALLQKLGVDHHFDLHIGDFEANDPSVCSRVGCSKEEFLRRCEQSAATVEAQLAEAGIPASVGMFYQRYGDAFEKLKDEARDSLAEGSFGYMNQALEYPAPEHATRIARSNHSFYERWHGRDLSLAEVTELVISQSAEYSALAKIMRDEHGQHSFQLAADRPGMQPFGSFFQISPVLCAKRTY